MVLCIYAGLRDSIFPGLIFFQHTVGNRLLLIVGKLRFCDRPYTRGVVSRSGNATRRLRSAVSFGYVCDLDAKACVIRQSDLVRLPVVVLAFVAPGNLQGFGPALSHALGGALAEVTPPIREIPTHGDSKPAYG